jgi:hypothetical protein
LRSRRCHRRTWRAFKRAIDAYNRRDFDEILDAMRRKGYIAGEATEVEPKAVGADVAELAGGESE